MELAKIFDVLRRYLLLIVASTVIAATAGYLAQRQQPAMYVTAATVIVGRAIEDLNPSNSEFFAGQQLATTYSEIATRRPIRQATMTALGLSWLPEYVVTQVPDTQLLEIRVTDTDAARAQAVANELARQLVAISPGAQGKLDAERRTFIDQQTTDLETAIDSTKAEILQLKQQVAGLYSARDLAAANEQISALEQKLSGMQANYAALIGFLEGGVNTVQIVEWANLPRQPVSAGGLPTILVLASMGLMLGIGTALLLEYLDDTLRSPEDVQTHLSLPILSGIPRLTGTVAMGQPALLDTSLTADLEAYRLLLTNIRLEGACTTLLVTSAEPKEGKTSLTVHLGQVAAMEGKRVVVIDGDLRRPTLHKAFDLRAGDGLGNALSQDGRTAASYLRQTSVPNLRVMTAGTSASSPAILLKSERLHIVLTELCQEADVILLDSTPILAATDVLSVARNVQGVLLVVDAGHTRRKTATEAIRMLSSVDTNLLGVVLNRVSPQFSVYHQYADYYQTRPQSENPNLLERIKHRLRLTPDRSAR